MAIAPLPPAFSPNTCDLGMATEMGNRYKTDVFFQKITLVSPQTKVLRNLRMLNCGLQNYKSVNPSRPEHFRKLY